MSRSLTPSGRRGLARALATSAALLPLLAHATVAVPVPEPESWALAAIAGIAAAIVTIRNRRK